MPQKHLMSSLPPLHLCNHFKAILTAEKKKNSIMNTYMYFVTPVHVIVYSLIL